MSQIKEDIEFCRTKLRRALNTISDFENGMRWKRGTAASGMTDISDQHKKLAEEDAAYWRARLQMLGASEDDANDVSVRAKSIVDQVTRGD